MSFVTGNAQDLENEVPGRAAAPQVVIRSGDAAVVLTRVEVFRNGARFSVEIDLRRSDAVWDAADGWRRFDELLLGVELPDGTRVVRDWGHHWSGGRTGGDDGPALLLTGGGGGGGRHYASDWFLSPLPEPGDLVVVAALPGAGLAEGRVVVPAAAMASARGAIVTLWPWEQDVDQPPPPPPHPPLPAEGWFADAVREPPDLGHVGPGSDS